jgi:cobalt-zinc-cadmium efflux system membrane fusion protein
MVDIHEKDLAKVRRGQTATVMVNAFPDTKFRGRVTYLADVVDEATRTIKARVEVANPGRKLKPEMFATVELAIAADAAAVLAVPEEAAQELEGKKLVFVAEGEGAFESRRVELGRASGGMVEVLSGLKEGERLAVKGGFVLKSELQKGEIEGHDH